MRPALTASLLIVTALGAVCGCSLISTPHPEPDRGLIESQFSRLDLAHGISRGDAVIIAEHYMLSKGYDYDWYVASPSKVSDEPERNSWTVEFEPKEDGYGNGPRRKSELTFQMLLPYWVTIRKDTGDISVVVMHVTHK